MGWQEYRTRNEMRRKKSPIVALSPVNKKISFSKDIINYGSSNSKNSTFQNLIFAAL